MQHRFLLLGRYSLWQALFLSSLLVLPVGVQHGWAQDPVGIPATALEGQIGLEQILRRGLELEEAKLWSDALLHYEKALRDHPDQRDLEERLTLAQIHCDVARRYTDHSFQRLTATIESQQAMRLYAEVMRKIHVHYVEAPQWQDLLWRGTANLDVAVTKKEFTDSHIPQATAEQINAFRHNLRRSINTRQVRNPEESAAVVDLCCRTAYRDLGVKAGAVILEYICGAVSALDPYSSYLTGAQLDEIYSQIEGSFVGLGIEIKSEGGFLWIVKTIPGGPAERSGIRAGDRIMAVNGRPVKDMSTEQAADLLKGQRGTTVRVALMDANDSPRELSIERQEIEVPSVEAVQILDPTYGIAYFRLATFQKTTSRDIDAALWKLHSQGMRSLIIDVRGNPGGLLSAAVEVADKFLGDGMIVSTQGRSARENYDYRAHPDGTWSVPLIVLIDEDTASASEILAGAIRDHRRGAVIGHRSYGKGSVQGIFPLQVARGGVRLTTAKFYTPSGHQISQRGVQPDLVVQQTAKPVVGTPGGLTELESDAVLAAAEQAARRQLLAHRQ